MTISLVSSAELITWAQTNFILLLVFALILLTVFALAIRAFSQRQKRENLRQSCAHTEKGEKASLVSETGEAGEVSEDIQTAGESRLCLPHAEELKNEALGSIQDVKTEPKSSGQII